MRVDAESLKAYVQAIFVGAGLPAEDAFRVADNLVFADLRGIDSHGVSRVPVYLKRLETGGANPRPDIRVVVDQPGLCLLDGDAGMGQVTATRGMDEAIARARLYGTATVFVRNSNHFGMASYFTSMATRAGMVGMAFSNAPPAMAAWGGTQAVLGTNPLSLAFPGGETPPVVVDMATTVVARGKIRQAEVAGKAIPEGWALDREGRTTTNPTEALEGTLYPLGGVKGYALGASVDLLSGVLSGAGYADHLEQMYGSDGELTVDQRVGHCFVVINANALWSTEELTERMSGFRKAVTGGPKAPGVKELLLPGDLESRAENARLQEGIDLSKATVEALNKVGRSMSLAELLSIT